MALADLPMPIRSYLHRFAARRQRLAFLRAAGRATMWGLLWLLLACLGDRLLQFPPLLRLVLLVMGTSMVLLIVARPLWRMVAGRVDWRAVTAQIERLNPVFGQRLQTVVSQMLEPRQHRGSASMLQSLADQVARQTHVGIFRWPDVRDLAGPWIGAGLVLLVILLLARHGSLGMPVLIGRLLRPTAPIAAVTTTQIAVTPKDSTVLRGQALSVRATIRHLNGGSVDIFASQDAKAWSRIPMTPTSGNEYIFSLGALDRDVSYYIKAGDAQTPTYKASVLRPPAVAEYRIRYQYPPYAQRNPITLTNTDGVIDALAGTRVDLTIIATEPLRQATLSVGGITIPLTVTSQGNACQGQFAIGASQRGDLELISMGGLLTRLPAGLTIHAQPDRPPLVRLLQPADDLRLQPRDVLPIHYQALDDYGIVDLTIAIQCNSLPAVEQPITRRGDARRQEGQFPFDLGNLDLKIGDVLTITLLAKDGSGKSARSEPRRILISPRSVDMNVHQRIAELKQAAQLAAIWRDELRQASQALALSSRNDRSASERINDRLKVSRGLANAMEAALMLNQSLIRTCARSTSPTQTIALAQYVDQARTQLSTGERLANLAASDATEQSWTDRLTLLGNTAAELRTSVKTLSEGEQAAALLTDRDNLRQPPVAANADRAAADRWQRAMDRARLEVAQAVEQLGLPPRAADLDQQLQRKVDAATGAVAAAKTVDFAAAAAQFAAAISANESEYPPLPERLAAAAAVEALRPDGDPICARDLQLASRAVSRLAEPLPLNADTATRQASRAALAQLPQVLSTLQKEHAANRAATDFSHPTPDQLYTLAETRQAGAAARLKLGRWAGQTENGLLADNPQDAAPEDLALEASAKTARRDYAPAAALDRQLIATARNTTPAQALAADDLNRAMASVAAIDNASAAHQQITQQTTNFPTPRQAAILAMQQRQVANTLTQIRSVPDSHARQKAMATLQQIQEQLAHLPQQMTQALEAANSYRKAAATAHDARNQVRSLPANERNLAQREADQAQLVLQDTEDQLEILAQAINPDLADRMALQLQAWEPETEEAGLAILEDLQPALKMLQQCIRAGERLSVDRAAAQVRDAIQETQSLLGDAQIDLSQRDPLVAAKWFTQAASTALAQLPPDFPAAATHQATAAIAMEQAWRNSMRQAASQRLALTPSFRLLLGNPASTNSLDKGAQAIGQLLPGLRQWGFLPQRQPEPLNTPLRQADAPAYQESLRLYFEGLGKTQELPATR